MTDALCEEVDLSTVKKRSLTGVVALTSRTFLIQAVSFASTFLLTVFLDPGIFGVFFMVSAFINFFSYFSDIGLAAALIQKKNKISDVDLKTTFVVQQVLALLLLALIFIASPFIKRWYSLSGESLFLFYSLGISFFLSSLKTIPSVLLERNLKFNLLIVPQLVETLVFNLVAVVLAWKGFGIATFSWAVLARAVSGLLVMYLVSPWKIGFAFSKESLKELLRFGVPYQVNTFIAVVKDDLMTVILGKIVGATGLGYLGWAKKWAEQPLRFFMDNVLKVTFPAFSRIQEDKEYLKKGVEKTLFFLTFLIFPVLVGISVLGSDMVKLIPKYLKWQPALLALYFYCFNSAWASISTTMTNLLNAIGKIKITFKLMLMWLFLTWALMPIMGFKFGYNGIALSAAIISISSIVAIYYAKKYIDFGLIASVGKPLLASIIMGISIYLIKFPSSLATLVIVKISLGVLVYFSVSYLLIGKSLIVDVRKIFYEIKSGSSKK